VFGIETLDGPVRAAVLVGIVLIESVGLYVGYGALERHLGPPLVRVVQGRCRLAAAVRGNCPRTDASAEGER
jgi:hypothetical protein